MFDILIKNGTVIDGTGREMFRADVGVKEDKVLKIGNLHDEKGKIEINANGKFVCPGFVDVNNHSDTYWQIFLNPNLESLVYQGITTIVGGNCGSSLAPLLGPRAIETIQKWTDLGKITVNWLELEEFFNVLEKRNLSVNFATLVGHANLRRGILKDESRSLVSGELNFINKKLKECLKKGALGMSTGLIYTHANSASFEELRDLAKVVAEKKKVYVTHIRQEKGNLVESLEEAVKIAQESKVKLHISHLKVMGKNNWPKMEEALEMIDHAKENGVDITFDVFPYTQTGSVLYTLLPSWVTEGGKRTMLHRLKDPKTRSRVVAEMKKEKFEYDKVEIAISPLNKTLARRKITEIAASQEKSVEEALIDILIASNGRVITSMDVLSEENIKKAIRNPVSIISSNGSGYNLEHRKTGENVHPRSFGTFIKVLDKYVEKERVITWEEAIRKMTGLPAEKFGISRRGLLKEGNFADIVVLDRKRLESPANAENPYQYSRGVECVLVNGKAVLEGGNFSEKRPGRIIKS